jgi:transcriptional regulator with XRE-family HTH domain
MEYKISLAAARVNAGLTIRDAATRLQISDKTLSNWETGKTAPNTDKLAQLLELYGAPLEVLILPKKSAESV